MKLHDLDCVEGIAFGKGWEVQRGGLVEIEALVEERGILVCNMRYRVQFVWFSKEIEPTRIRLLKNKLERTVNMSH